MHPFTSLRLRYLEFPGRAQAIRDTLRIGRIDFVDEHLSYERFCACRAAGEFPFGGIPVLVIETQDGTQCVAQSNAILRFAGRLAGLYPLDDPLAALKVDEALGVGEDINCLLGPSLHEQDAEKKMALRKVLAEETLPYWMGCLERLLLANGGTGFIAGATLTIADLKLYWIIDWLTLGILDGIPKTLVDDLIQVGDWRRNINAVRAARLPESTGH
ncbi:MAG: glutathione S-transferase [Pseudomonadota bacterium]